MPQESRPPASKPISKTKSPKVAKRWPVADPAPAVIDLLRRVSHIDDRSVMPDAARQTLREEAIEILRAWDENEDIEQLRERLGLKPKRGRRRTQRTVNQEFAIAYAYAEHQARRTHDARGTVAEEFSVDVRTVDRAFESWGHVVLPVIRIAREHFPGSQLDYSNLKNMQRKK